MRCKICDWSPHGPQSAYHSGLGLSSRAHHFDHEKQEWTCESFDYGVSWVDGYYDVSDIGSMEVGDLTDE